MIKLRKAREASMQVLFQRSFQEDSSSTDLFNSFADNFTFDKHTRDYSRFLTEGVISNEEKVNSMIEKYSENWRIDRIAVIDKILMQIAIFELCISTETPTAAKLCMTDIIDLAKKYSSEDSKKFINGILDRVYQQENLSES